MELTKEQRIFQQVVSEAWNNADYKAELMDNPAAAIEKLTGESIDLPQGKRLQVYDQSNSDVVCLNIPPQPNLDNYELTDQQLEVVAGGCIPHEIIIGCFFPPKPTFPTPPTQPRPDVFSI